MAARTNRLNRKSHADTPSQRETVVLQRDGQYVSVYPAVQGLIEQVTSIRHIPDPDTGRTLSVTSPIAWPINDRWGRRMLQTFAGQESQLTSWLECNGFEVELTGERPPRWTPPDDTRWTALGISSDRGLLDYVREQDRGLFRVGADVDPARLVAQMALAWNEARILVLASRRQQAKAFRDRLGAFLPNVSLHAGRSRTTAARVAVATPGYARDGAVAIESRTVVVALDPAAMFSGRELASPIDILRHARRARLYGVLPIGAEPAPYTRSLITALFGPDQVVIPRHGSTVRAVEVAFVRIDGGPRIQDHDVISLLRSGIWQHPIRNRRLARLAERLALGQFDVVRESCPQLGGVRFRKRPNSVVLLTANLEQALVLVAKLPAARLACGSHVWSEGFSTEQHKLLEERTRLDESANLVIATAAGLPNVDSVDVLIRADGGHDLPRLAEGHLVVHHGVHRRLAVIDAADGHHPTLRIASRDRKAAYRDAGWTVVGDSESEPQDHKLAGRPEVQQ